MELSLLRNTEKQNYIKLKTTEINCLMALFHSVETFQKRSKTKFPNCIHTERDIFLFYKFLKQVAYQIHKFCFSYKKFALCELFDLQEIALNYSSGILEKNFFPLLFEDIKLQTIDNTIHLACTLFMLQVDVVLLV